MDPRIEALRSTTFFGRRLTRQQISEIHTSLFYCYKTRN